MLVSSGETKKQLNEARYFIAFCAKNCGARTRCPVSAHFEAQFWQENLGAFSGVGAAAVGHTSSDDIMCF